MKRGFARWLVRLYPREWRERYEEEFVALLEDRRASSFADAFDIALGALDARLSPQVQDGRTFAMVARMRGSVLAVLWAWVGFVVAGLGFQKMTEYDDFVEAARENVVIGAAFDAVVVGAVVALFAVAAGGLPVAYAALRGALAEGRKDVPLLFAVPPLALVAFVGYTLLLTRVISPLAAHAALNVAFFVSLVAVFLLAAIASTAAVSAAVSRVEVDGRLFRFALWPATVATLAMAVVLGATVVWGAALRVQAPALFAGDDGILGISTVLNWLVIVAVMAACTCAAAVSVARGLSARS